MFGVVFPNRSFPMDASSFAQIDTFHWILDLAALAAVSGELREVCVFLLNAASLPAGKSLAVYAQPAGANAAFALCGAVTPARPSAVLALPSAAAKLGLCVEDEAATESAMVVAGVSIAGEEEKRIERVAMKVGENLFNFMQSFCSLDGSRLVVPMDILERWFKKFQQRAKLDPQYLKSFVL